MYTKPQFPKVFVVERDGWRMTIAYRGVFEKFVFGVAQAGDPKGTVTLEGPDGMRITLKTWTGNLGDAGDPRWPLNLRNNIRLVSLINAALSGKYNVRVDLALLRNLAQDAMQPYGY